MDAAIAQSTNEQMLLNIVRLRYLEIPGFLAVSLAAPALRQLFIMGDDIGWMQPSVYHRGLMVGESPN